MSCIHIYEGLLLLHWRLYSNKSTLTHPTLVCFSVVCESCESYHWTSPRTPLTPGGRLSPPYCRYPPPRAAPCAWTPSWSSPSAGGSAWTSRHSWSDRREARPWNDGRHKLYRVNQSVLITTYIMITGADLRYTFWIDQKSGPIGQYERWPDSQRTSLISKGYCILLYTFTRLELLNMQTCTWKDFSEALHSNRKDSYTQGCWLYTQRTRVHQNESLDNKLERMPQLLWAQVKGIMRNLYGLYTQQTG